MIREHKVRENQIEKEAKTHPWKVLASFHCKNQGYYKSLLANLGGSYKVETEMIPGVDEPKVRYEGQNMLTAIFSYNNL